MFASGNFQTPMFIHDVTPPGVPVMESKRDLISYLFEPTPKAAGSISRLQTRLHGRRYTSFWISKSTITGPEIEKRSRTRLNEMMNGSLLACAFLDEARG